MDEFQEVFEKYAPVVYRFLLSHCQDPELADELTGETFYQAYLHIGSFRGESRIETWLCQIARNALSKERKRRGRLTELDPEAESPSPDLFSRFSDREQALLIHRQLHALPEPYREVFTLRVFGDLSFKDIAGIFEKTESWAKVTYYRAKDKLIEKMEVEHEDQLSNRRGSDGPLS